MYVIVAIDGLGRLGLNKIDSNLFTEFIWSDVKSVIPYITPTGFTSLWTGRCPAEHGIIGIESFSNNDNYAHGERIFIDDLINYTSPRIFDVLAEAGYKVGCFDLPMSYIPFPTKAEIRTVAKTYFADVYWRGFKTNEIPVDEPSQNEVGTTEWNADYLRSLMMTLEMKKEFFMKEDFTSYDFLFIGFHEPDPIAHMYGFGDHYNDVMKIIDEIVRRFRDERIIIVTDHGIENSIASFNLVSFLDSKGLIKVDEKKLKVDFKKSLAFPVTTKKGKIGRQDFGIFLNSQRKKHGFLNEEEVKNLRGELLASLGEVEIVEAAARENLYQGRFLENCPDIYVFSNKGILIEADYSNPEMIVPKKLPIHSLEGVFGSNFCKLPIFTILEFFNYLLRISGVDLVLDDINIQAEKQFLEEEIEKQLRALGY